MKNKKFIIIVFFAYTGLTACQTAPNIQEFANDSDLTFEINRVENRIHDDLAMQVDVLSPENFRQASNALSQAKVYREKNKEQKKVLHEVAISEAYLNNAEKIAKVSEQILSGVAQKRQLAIAANAQKYFSKDLSNLDETLSEATKSVENNDTTSAVEVRAQLQEKYGNLEIKSIKQANLGEAQKNISLAIKEGAEKYAPRTLAWAQLRISNADRAIEANLYDSQSLSTISENANSAANRLLSIVRQAKSSSQQTPEQLARQLEKDKLESQSAASEAAIELRQTRIQLRQSKDLNENRSSEINVLATQNNKLKNEEKLESEYVSARNTFTNEEAEIYKQGDKLLLRLKGLTFPVNQSVIGTENYALLSKVQKIIKESLARNVLIEGHTDSTGSKATNEKLSQDRADSVEKYLLANSFNHNEKILAKGFGDSKPLATNKTSEGRSQNRRVDIIITDSQIK